MWEIQGFLGNIIIIRDQILNRPTLHDVFKNIYIYRPSGKNFVVKMTRKKDMNDFDHWKENIKEKKSKFWRNLDSREI